MIYFDIETEPLPEDDLRRMCPPFDPDSVKCGNMGPAKAAEKIAMAEANHFTDFVEWAALSPMTGSVCAIGIGLVQSSRVQSGDVLLIDCAIDESVGLRKFWYLVEEDFNRRVGYEPVLVGFNTHGFDLPFLVKRSWLRGVPVPALMRLDRDRYWPEWNLDLYKLWQFGDRQGGGKLDEISKAFGLEGKTGDHGHEFGRLWREDRARAEAYLRQDVMQCVALHERMAFGSGVMLPLLPEAEDEIPFPEVRKP